MATLFKNDFYTIDSLKASNDRKNLHATIRLNRDHTVFTGHFPNSPVVPGVFMIQLITELLSEFLSIEMDIKQISSVKYLSFIDPNIHQTVDVKMEQIQEHLHSYQVTAVVFSEEQVFMKCKALFQENPRETDA